MPWWRILAHSLQAPLLSPACLLLLLRLHSLHTATATRSVVISARSHPLDSASDYLLFCKLSHDTVSGVEQSVGASSCISNLSCGSRTGKCLRGIEVNTVKSAPLLTEHTYRHPSTCRALCHTSQQPADGFIHSPALSPLLFYVTFLFFQPSASICLPSAPSS